MADFGGSGPVAICLCAWCRRWPASGGGGYVGDWRKSISGGR